MSKVNKCPKCGGELCLHKPNSKDEYLVCKRCDFRAKIKEKASVMIGLAQLNILKPETTSIQLAELKILKKETYELNLKPLGILKKETFEIPLKIIKKKRE